MAVRNPKPEPTQAQRDDYERRQLFDALERALTPELWSKTRNYAHYRAAMLARAGIYVDDAYVDRLVGDAISDTATGRLTWKHDKLALSTHLHAVIRSRTYKRLQRHRRYWHTSINEPVEDGELHPVELEASMAKPAPSAHDILEQADLLHQARQRLRSLCDARGDTIGLAILECYRRGQDSRAAIAGQLGISLREFDRARERLVERAAGLGSAESHPAYPRFSDYVSCRSP